MFGKLTTIRSSFGRNCTVRLTEWNWRDARARAEPLAWVNQNGSGTYRVRVSRESIMSSCRVKRLPTISRSLRPTRPESSSKQNMNSPYRRSTCWPPMRSATSWMTSWPTALAQWHQLQLSSIGSSGAVRSTLRPLELSSQLWHES